MGKETQTVSLLSDYITGILQDPFKDKQVRAWNQKVLIPTYSTGEKEKNPMFLEKRVYQGSSGVVYPYPVIEKINDDKTNQEWDGLFLENSYLLIMILPELGGRIQMAYDKLKNRHFVYFNQVIKPALVGLTGPWISGGIEFNWPQHHRPTTFDPVDHTITENRDGSVTVWCNEFERMFRTQGTAGFTLYPDHAYLEINVKLFNNSLFPQTFLWWANPAVKVNDDYQSVFPPDVHAVYDHGRRDVSKFPVADGIYYKVDYSPGTDISLYKNIPVPTSFMAVSSRHDFIGGYENDSHGGLLHVANHLLAPGKKQWTWGNGDFGKAWDRNLTDEDGPYIELMCGVFTDNQPDFSWLMPGETKNFRQYFMPYRDLGAVKNATKEAMVNLEIRDGNIEVKAYTTAHYPGSKVVLKNKNEVILKEIFDFHPGTSYFSLIQAPGDLVAQDLEVTVISGEDKSLVGFRPEAPGKKEVPEPAKAAALPAEINSNEQLFLTGLHLEQYRHATYDPRDYYLEALRRDPDDSRCNNALGLWYLRRANFDQAISYFENAVSTLTRFNPNPIDGEPLYNLGIARLLSGNEEDAYNAFYKAVWNAAWMDSGYFQIARLETKRGYWPQALEAADLALAKNWKNQKIRLLKVAILRKMEDKEKALDLIKESLLLDPFSYGVLFEKYLLNQEEDVLDKMKKLMRGNIHTYMEFALDYGYAGLWDEAIRFIQTGIEGQGPGKVYPLAFYYKAWFEWKNGNTPLHAGDPLDSLRQASSASPDYCFPNQPEAVIILEWARKFMPSDPKAPYYLGNFHYNSREYEIAIKCWEDSVTLDDQFPTAHRNLALAYFNKENNTVKARLSLEKAFSLDRSDARIGMELDQLYKRLNHHPEMRWAFLEENHPLVEKRDDLFLEKITLLNMKGMHEEAYRNIMSRKFHPWEGGEGKVSEQYVWSLTELAKKAIQSGNFPEALSLLRQTRIFPENLGEGKLAVIQENDVNYLLGIILDKMGDKEGATQYWLKASEGLEEPSLTMFYNDLQPDSIYYQGLALLRLGRTSLARKRFQQLIEYGDTHLNDTIHIDYFAVSLPDILIWDDDLNARNRQMCLYLKALGQLGLGNKEEAINLLSEVLRNNLYHKGAHIHFNDLKNNRDKALNPLVAQGMNQSEMVHLNDVKP
ncbi:MAG TPA: DUF5107 domain-containing protein [Prolixibacteraceae bacterium]|jgi:tetratricopeptide (TPR) repeat protein|nr:DUF5107 domain-containing protein [Prolixibacteraceae bacterium]HRV90317.1 DUF5107 domain-containing protein [Prolixibacteraceae bacterium]